MLRALRPALRPVAAACALAGASPIAFAQDAAAADGARSTSLAPVVVSGQGFEQRAFDTPYSVNVIDAETLRNGGLMVNLSESMARVPGLNVANRNNYAQDLQVSSRGYGARSTFGVRGMRLYSDGIPATMPDGQGQVSHFDLAGAQRVEVLRGPFSALYGNSSGGVIALFSAPVTERYAELDLDAGRFGQRQARLTVQAPLSDTPGRGWDLRVGASRFETDGFRPQSEADRTLANVRLGWTGERDKVTLVYNHLEQPAEDPLGLNFEDFRDDPYQTVGAATDFDTRKDVDQDQVGVNWRHRFEDLGALSESAVTAYGGRRSVVQYQSIPVATQAAPRSPGGVIDFDRDYGGVDGRLIWRWTLAGDRSAQFVAGAAYEEAEEDRLGFNNFVGEPPDQVLGVKGDKRRDETNKVRTSDAYAQGEIEFAKGWTATLGVRTGKVKFRSDDHFIQGPNGDDSGSLSYDYTNPVAALQWRAAPNLNLYVSAGRGFESPTLNELAYRPDGQPGFNDDLDAQKSTQVEIGAKWRLPELGLSLDVAIFEARTEDELGVATNSGGRSTFQNVGDTTRRGAELAAGFEPNRYWRAALALTFLHADYDDDFETCYGVTPPCTADSVKNVVPGGTRIAGTSPRSAYAELAWSPFGNEATELAAELRAQDRVATNDLNAGGEPDDFAPGWSTVALRARQQWRIRPGSLLEGLVRVDNLFDREYAGSVIVNEGNRRFFEPGMPRSWLLALKWRQAF
jgi:iron complex outermembrane receptor protein